MWRCSWRCRWAMSLVTRYNNPVSKKWNLASNLTGNLPLQFHWGDGRCLNVSWKDAGYLDAKKSNRLLLLFWWGGFLANVQRIIVSDLTARKFCSSAVFGRRVRLLFWLLNVFSLARSVRMPLKRLLTLKFPHFIEKIIFYSALQDLSQSGDGCQFRAWSLAVSCHHICLELCPNTEIAR